MASIVWNRDAQEAMDNPYEYNAQDQFYREAVSLTAKLCSAIITVNRFSVDNQSLEKATWLLQTDAVHAFKDAIELLAMKKHKVVGRLLRDILETIHLIEYFNSGYVNSDELLNKWFNDEPVTDKRYRAYIKNTFGDDQHQAQLANYEALSKFTHRTYKILLYGYARLGDNSLHYDEQWSLPGTIAMYYALLGWMGNMVVSNLKTFGVLSKDTIDSYWNESMEEFQIPRGYLSKENKEFLG
jgi:hypothetical protein